MTKWTLGFLSAFAIWPLLAGQAQDQLPAGLVRVGAGSYVTQPPPGTRLPPARIYRAPELAGPTPTSDWWSSLAWLRFSETMYAHPLALRAQPDGLRVWHPSEITANKIGLFGTMPAVGATDLVLGHSRAPQFPEALLAGSSDWFVTAAFATNTATLRVSFGHGSPFVYATYGGGEPVVKFAKPPLVWSGDANSPVLGLTVERRHYGLFAPAGSRWSGLGGAELACATGGKTYFALAALPDNRPETLARFRQFAYAHVTNTTVSWAYDPATATVTTRFEFATRAFEGAERGTLFALYPHQWRGAGAALTGATYPSVRGPLKLASGSGFTTRMKFPGLLPVLPNLQTDALPALRQLLAQAAAEPPRFAPDTYWDGKNLGRLATLMQIAREAGAEDARRQFRERLRGRLEHWLSADDPNAQPKSKQLFVYDRNWGTLIGVPASYGSDTELNDHHFHYGYFVHAAAALALEDPEWARLWGGMVELLARDFASGDRNDPLFPFLRCFDPYAGHSWASGAARFADGNNQESSSEAVNAWAGLLLWGEATGNARLRDLGAWLYTTEIAAIEDYWFDVRNDLRPAAYTPSVATMVWGGKSVNETWFSNRPEDVHMINWLPFTGASLYLGRFPAYARRNYEALRAEAGGDDWRRAVDFILMYRALDDANDAWRQYQPRAAALKTDSGNSPANVLHWISSLQALGQVDAAVTADHPTALAFRRGQAKSYVFYNPRPQPATARFSDGAAVTAPARGFGVQPPPARRAASDRGGGERLP